MRAKTRNVFFALLGVAGLVLEGHYRGPYQQAVHSYGGNIAASFAVYYIVALLPLPPRFGKLLTAGQFVLGFRPNPLGRPNLDVRRTGPSRI